jgi:hypothetical protein
MAGRTKTLPWWLEGEGIKTIENKIHWPVGLRELKFSEKLETDPEKNL